MDGDGMELWQLRQRQSLPLEVKIVMSQIRIRQWYEAWDGQVYVSFSGGKDSTVLLHLVRELYPKTPAVFVDTGLEYPEIRDFVKTVDNVVWLKPKMRFQQVIEKYGYPVVSKKVAQYVREIQTPTERNKATVRLRLTGIRSSGKYSGYSKIPDKWLFLKDAPFKIGERCCKVMKKEPMDCFGNKTGRVPFVGVMASDGANRQLDYIMHGCNMFDAVRPISRPLEFWMEHDVWDYLRSFKKAYSKVYDSGYTSTGCMFCMFGVHLERGVNRFQRMKHTHPKQWEYCMAKLGLAKVLDYIGVDWGGQMDLMDYSGVIPCNTK